MVSIVVSGSVVLTLWFQLWFRLYDLTQSPSSKVRLLSLRLLVNLSTNEEMVPHLLAAKVRP